MSEIEFFSTHPRELRDHKARINEVKREKRLFVYTFSFMKCAFCGFFPYIFLLKRELSTSARGLE